MRTIRRRAPRRRTLLAFATAVASAVVLTLTVGAGAVTNVVNLTTAGASGSAGGALFVQGVGPAGTGQFDPFLTLSTNAPTESGWNSNSAPSGDAFYGGGRTHPVLLSTVPQMTVGGVVYRELGLDANDQGSDDWMSIDELKLFVSTQNDLKGYVDSSETFSNGSATKVYDMGDAVVLLRSQALSSGSGQSDITVFVPDPLFPSGCSYGETGCDKYLVVYTAMGGYTGDATHNWDVTAGFEEWQTRKLPVVSVAKTVVPSFTRSYDWTVKKYVSLNGTDWQDASVALDLFNGQSSTVYWKIDAVRGDPQDGAAKASGTVTVTNPTGSAPFTFGVDATVTGVADVLSQTGLSDTNVTLSCGTFPKTLKPGGSFQCTYTNAALPGVAAGTNTATATLSTGDRYSGSAAVDFTGATPTLVDATASLDDLRDSALPTTLSGSDSISYSETLGCGSSRTIMNTATLTESNGTRTDSAAVDIGCHPLVVTKTATPSFTRTYGWTVKKYVSLTGADGTWQDASVAFKQFDGDSSTVYWKVVPTRDAGTDSAWHVTGTITVTNDAPIAATGVSVADAIAGVAGAATVDCDPGTPGNQTTVDVPAKVGSTAGTATCSYSSDLPDATTRLNTATATLAGVDYTGTRSVDFTAVAPNEVNATATLSDTNTGSLGAATSGTAVSYSTSVGCGVDRTITNTATVTFGSSTATDDAAVAVDCLQLTVTKTATPSFTRTWTWTVDKGATDSALTLQVGETFLEPYTVTYGATKADTDFAVSGTITVTSPADAPTRTVDVSDVYGSNTASVDCNGATSGTGLPVSLAAGQTLDCTYTVALDAPSNASNTATATLTNVPSGTTQFASNPVAVTFGSPTTETDETIAVTDTAPAGSYCTGAGTPILGCTAAMVGTGPPSGTVTATSSPFTKTFTYTRIVGPYTSLQCGSQNVDNTADLTTNDTATHLSDSVRIVVTIPCPTGCTLTQGYWKTHSILGPAPFDDTWELVPAVGPMAPYAPSSIGTHENLRFFYSGQTWYQVFWTAPKGGNAYYILAHQYEAAVLNVLAGADASTILPTLSSALTLLGDSQATPDRIGRLKGSDPTRMQWISLAGALGAYNEGVTGPGHCDEDMTRSTAP